MRLDEVALHARHFVSTDAVYLRRLSHLCLQKGLSIYYIGVYNDFGQDPETCSNYLSQIKDWIDRADYMGVPVLRIFAASVKSGDNEQSVRERMIPYLMETAEYGEKKGVIIALQNHNHGNVTHSGKVVRSILKAVNNPYFSHILDTGQYIGSPGASGAGSMKTADERLYENIAETAPLALHVRAKFYRIQSGEEAWLDYPRILKILEGVGYNGGITIVYEGWEAEEAETAVPKAVAYLRRVMSESKNP